MSAAPRVPRPLPRLVPYQPPPENLASDQRRQLLWLFEHEIRRAQGVLTPKQLAVQLLTRLDLQGLGPGNHAPPRPATSTRRGWCDTHAQQIPTHGRCPGCAADAKAAPDPEQETP